MVVRALRSKKIFALRANHFSRNISFWLTAIWGFMSKKFAYKTKMLFSYVLNAKKWLNIIYFFLESSLNLKKVP